jgi:hypothetical protein
MSLTPDKFLADVAAVYAGSSACGAFGSGRLIAPGLVLTAGHVVDYPTRETPALTDWKVVLVRDRTPDGFWVTPAYKAELIWRGKAQLDLALLKINDDPQPRPVLSPVFSCYDLVGPLGDICAAGFPEAWLTEAEAVRDYSVSGVLRIVSQLGPYAWSVLPADKPDDRRGWKGMSGAALCRVGEDDRLYLFGAVQEIPANFSHGLLEAARLSKCFDDPEFRDRLKSALGAPASLMAFKPGPNRADLGITRVFQTRTRAFAEEYLVSETGPVPFGGRDYELHRLDNWLLDPGSAPRMLVTAPAGRGKSALLVRWIKNLQDGGVCGVDGWQLAFMPISIRTGTNRPEVFYEGLARRLSEISSEALPTEAFRDSDGFRYAVRDQLDRLASAGKPRVLVVLDGIDEALEGSFDPAVLPNPLPANIRVLLSARWQLGDQNSKGWSERLGWDRGVKVNAFELDRLGAKQIADVFVKLGAPVAFLAEELELVERLAQLTEGEPLLIRFYAEDLWSAGSKGARIGWVDLDNLRPGFDSYFRRWFELQEKLWKEEGGHVDRREVDAVLSILAFALGPLGEADLLALMERIHGLRGLIAARRLLEPLRRWVFGSGKRDAGYVLTHPKVGEYLQGSLFAANANQVRLGFTEWGKAHCTELNEGRLRPEHASPYCLQFLPDHLKQVHASPDDFMLMVENGWRVASDKFEGGQRGFANAVQTAFEALRWDTANLRIGAQWRCALVLSSIRSLGRNVPVELILAAVDKGVLTIRQAANLADLKGPSIDAVRLLVQLSASGRGEPTLRSELLSSALASAAGVRYPGERARAFALVAPNLPKEQREQAVKEAIASASGVFADNAITWCEIAPYLSPQERQIVLTEVLAQAKTKSGSLRILTLSQLSRSYPELIGEVIDALREENDEAINVRVILNISQIFSSAQIHSVIEFVRTIANEKYRFAALSAVTKFLPSNLIDYAALIARNISSQIASKILILNLFPHYLQQQTTDDFDTLLDGVTLIDDEDYRTLTLTALLPHLQQSQLMSAFAILNTLRDEVNRARALIVLIGQLPTEMLTRAWDAVKTIETASVRLKPLLALAPRLPIAAFSDLEALASVIGEQSPAMELAKRLPSSVSVDLLEQALKNTQSFDDGSRAQVLAVLAPLLPQYLLPEALDLARTIVDALDDSIYAIVSLATKLPENDRQKELTWSLTTARELPRGFRKVASLLFVSARLNAELKGGVVEEARLEINNVTNPYMRQRATCRLIRYLEPDSRDDVLKEAVVSAGNFSQPSDRVFHWIELIGVEPKIADSGLISKMLDDICGGFDEDYQVYNLAKISRFVSTDLLPKAEKIIASIKNHDIQLKAKVLFACNLVNDNKPMDALLSDIDRIHSPYHRIMAMLFMVPILQEKKRRVMLLDAMRLHKNIDDAFERCFALSSLVEYAFPDMIVHLFELAQTIKADIPRKRALEELSSTHLILEQELKEKLIVALVLSCSATPQFDAFHSICSSADMIAAITGDGPLREIIRSAKDVCNWYSR